MLFDRATPTVVAVLGLCLACRSDAPNPEAARPTVAISPGSTAAPPLSVNLVHCATEAEFGYEFPPACKVAALIGGDTLVLEDLAVVDTPHAIGDSLWIGMGFDTSSGERALYRFDRGPRRFARIPMPDSTAFDIVPSPDARYLAYFTSHASDSVVGLVRRFPNGSVVFRTTPFSLSGTDVAVTGIQWLSGTEVLLYVQPDDVERHLWLRYSLSLPDIRSRVDTVDLSSKPDP
jgi:hypothetical protein